jgi:hypothetical protein
METEGVEEYDGVNQFKLAVSVGDEFASAVVSNKRKRSGEQPNAWHGGARVVYDVVDGGDAGECPADANAVTANTHAASAGHEQLVFHDTGKFFVQSSRRESHDAA